MDLPPGWTHQGNCLEKGFRFADFAEAFAFLTRVALHSQSEDHHPDFSCSWNQVRFRLTSHDQDAVTDRDLMLAKAIDRMAGA